GRPGGDTSAHDDQQPPGRCVWAGRTVQIAAAEPDTEAAAGAGECLGMGPAPGAPGGRPQPHPWPAARVVRPIPEHAVAHDMPRAIATAVPLGIGGDEARPVTTSLAGPGGAIVIAGPRRSGISTAIALITQGAVTAGLPVLRIDSTGARC